MNKIYIFENTNSLHIEEALITIYKLFKEKYRVRFCLNEKAMNRVINNNIIVENTHEITTFLDLIKFIRTIKKDDIVIYPTISTRNIALLFIMSFFIEKNIYYIRNSNSWIKYAKHQKSIKNRILSNMSTYLKKKILNKSYKIFVANGNLKNYLQNNHIAKKIEIVPYKIFDANKAKIVKYEDTYRFVIPGAIDISKKDLMLIRRATQLLNQKILEKIEIILLGKPSRDEDLDFCKSWKKEIGSSLQYFTSFIPDDEFTNVLSKSHFILGLLSIDYEDKYNKEIYGLTKDTGVEAQAIAYGKPLIINDDFKVITEIKNSSISFKDSEDLSKILCKIIENNNYEEIAEKAFTNSQKISLENIRKNLKDLEI